MKKLFGIVGVVAAVAGCGSRGDNGTCVEGAGSIQAMPMPAACQVNLTRTTCEKSAVTLNRKVEFFAESATDGAARCKGLGFINPRTGNKKGSSEAIRFKNDGDVERSLESGDTVTYDKIE